MVVGWVVAGEVGGVGDSVVGVGEVGDPVVGAGDFPVAAASVSTQWAKPVISPSGD